MVTKGDGKDRYVTIPKMMTFRVDNTLAQPNSEFVTLTLTELDSRRVFYKDVTFTNPVGKPNARAKEDEYFGYLFAMGEGQARETSQAARAAIQQGRVILGMSEDEVTLAMGEEPNQIVSDGSGKFDWIYYRSKGKALFIHFNRSGRVESYNTGASSSTSKKGKSSVKAANQRLKSGKEE